MNKRGKTSKTLPVAIMRPFSRADFCRLFGCKVRLRSENVAFALLYATLTSFLFAFWDAFSSSMLKAKGKAFGRYNIGLLGSEMLCTW